MSQREVFTAAFAAVSVTAAQDVFELVAPADHRLALREVRLAQHSDAGDAAAELLSVAIVRGHASSGSGGATAAPQNVNGEGRPAWAQVERNNTSQASDGGITLVADGFNIASGWLYRPPADERLIVRPGQRLVVSITAPADALIMDGTIVWDEQGPLKAGA